MVGKASELGLPPPVRVTREVNGACCVGVDEFQDIHLAE